MAVRLVLVADQDESRLIALQETITCSKRAVLTATTASECLALRLLFRPELVIVEVGMPNSGRIFERLLKKPLDPKIALLVSQSNGQSARYLIIGLNRQNESAILLSPGDRWPGPFHTDLHGSLVNGQPKRKRMANDRLSRSQSQSINTELGPTVGLRRRSSSIALPLG